MARSIFKPPVVYARLRSRMVDFGIDFHDRFIRGSAREEALSPGQSKRHMPSWTMNRVETRISSEGACVGPFGVSTPSRRVSILLDAQR